MAMLTDAGKIKRGNGGKGLTIESFNVSSTIIHCRWDSKLGLQLEPL